MRKVFIQMFSSKVKSFRKELLLLLLLLLTVAGPGPCFVWLSSVLRVVLIVVVIFAGTSVYCCCYCEWFTPLAPQNVA